MLYIEEGDQIIQYCDVKEPLDMLKNARSTADKWDQTYEDLKYTKPQPFK